jgi:hypothetical protein
VPGPRLVLAGQVAGRRQDFRAPVLLARLQGHEDLDGVAAIGAVAEQPAERALVDQGALLGPGAIASEAWLINRIGPLALRETRRVETAATNAPDRSD